MAVTELPRAHAPSALAQAVLMEVRDEPRTPISASEVGELMGLSEAETFPLLVVLEDVGLVKRHEGTRTEPLRWKATEAGFAYPVNLRGLSQDIMTLEAERQRVFALSDEQWWSISAALGVPEEHPGPLLLFRRGCEVPAFVGPSMELA